MNVNSPEQFTWETGNKSKQQEKGIALILTLGVLTILLVLGLAFVALAKTNRKLASINSDMVTTRLSAESVIERVIGSIELYNDDITEGKIYPGTSSFYAVTGSTDDAWDKRRVIFSFEKTGTQDTDWIHNFETSFSDSGGNSLDYIGWYGTASATFKSKVPVTWKYLKIDEDGDGTKDRIMGRIAYMIIDESGKLDPNYITSGGSRIGKEVSEISLTDAGVSNANNFTTALNGAPKWFSWAHIIGNTSFSQAELNTNTGVLFPFSYDIEAFHDDADGKDYHRFNLARTDWDTLDANSITGDATEWTKTPATHDGTGIPWFKNWGSGKDQVVANLLDYCDSDSIPKTDSDGTTAPTYLGLEKTAYINEIHVQINQTPVIKAANMGAATYTWIPVLISITPEIVNVYPSQVAACNLELQYEITGEVNKGHAVSYTLKSMNAGVPEEGLSGTLTYNFAATNARSFQTLAAQTLMFTGDSYATPDEALPVNLTINDIKLTALLRDGGGNLIDYAVIATNANAVDLNVHPGQKFANYQTNDPRYNQALNQWTALTGEIDSSTLNATNTPCNPGAAGDQDPGSNPWVSTCYIRNAPMESPWELGAIHRGAAWETINLKAFKSGATGGGSYANGDANILDQVKMTSDTVTPGKVNINSPVQDVQKALVKMLVGGDYTNLSGGIASDDSTISQAILNANGTTPGSTAFTSRAEVANVNALRTGQTTDAAKEEILGKIINLTTVRQNLFSVIILAQSIKDVGEDGSDITIFKDLDSDGDVSGNVDELNAGWDINGNDSDNNERNTPSDDDPTNDDVVNDQQAGVDAGSTGVDDDNNPESISARLGRYDQYADEITSEQKILAVIYRDAYTNKCKILYYEVLQD